MCCLKGLMVKLMMEELLLLKELAILEHLGLFLKVKGYTIELLKAVDDGRVRIS